jgi:2-(1,2-epoxy-1,2-dihydrophenyl)acetyl-CoA isomerase
MAVHCERDDAVVVVTLDRPGRRNALTAEMCEQLHEVLRAVAATDARVVVLRGAGDDFCVGADLGPDGGPVDATLERLGPVYHSATLLHTMPQVTIAAVDGGCAGGAMGWACACDFRFATPRARFATAFLKVGVAGDMGLAWSLPRVVGWARARELLFFGEKLTGDDALRLGLVTRLFSPGQLHDEVMALAELLAGRRPFALRMMKANVVAAETLGLADYIEIESARHIHLTGGRSVKERLEASRTASDGRES